MKIIRVNTMTWLIRHWWRWYLVKPAQPWRLISYEIKRGLLLSEQYDSKVNGKRAATVRGTGGEKSRMVSGDRVQSAEREDI